MEKSTTQFCHPCDFITKCSSVINIFFYPISESKFFGETIHFIEYDAFVGLKHLSSLELIFCGLNKMPPLSPVKGNFVALHLSSNCLMNIPGEYFIGFIRSMSINLDYKKLLAVPNIKPLKKTLALLNLSGNHIPSFDPYLTNTTFPALRTLGVNNNKIKYLSPDIISCWPNL